MKRNNVNLATLGAQVEKAKGDPAAARMQKKVEGRWSFAEGTP